MNPTIALYHSGGIMGLVESRYPSMDLWYDSEVLERCINSYQAYILTGLSALCVITTAASQDTLGV